MRCPVCRAELTEGPQCRRCRADLTPLFALEKQREQALQRARHYLQQGQYAHAAACADGADALRRGADARQLLALCHLLQKDFSRAWELYRQ